MERENARNRPATAVCFVCNKRFARRRRQNQHRRSHAAFTAARYCSDACRQAAYRTRRDIRNNIPVSARPRPPNKRIPQRNQSAVTPQKKNLTREIESNALQRAKTLSSRRILAPADVLAVEVFDRKWEPAVSSGGVAIEVARLRARALVS
jgi:hypothetical protein